MTFNEIQKAFTNIPQKLAPQEGIEPSLPASKARVRDTIGWGINISMRLFELYHTKQKNRLPNDIRMPKENIQTVMDSNFEYGRAVGTDIVKMSDLHGGVSTDPSETERVKKLASQIPNNYFERIIVDSDNNVIEGQHRLQALQLLGIEDVPVFRIEDMAKTLPVEDMKQAMINVGKIHSDNVHYLIKNIIEMIKESGNAQNAIEEWDLSGQFQPYYEAAFNVIL